VTFGLATNFLGQIIFDCTMDCTGGHVQQFGNLIQTRGILLRGQKVNPFDELRGPDWAELRFSEYDLCLARPSEYYN